MRIPIAAYTMYDWQGPSSGVKFRVVATESFVARDDDSVVGVNVDAAPNIFREVACTVSTAVVAGLTVNTINIPAMWLYSTTDGIANRSARYNGYFVVGNRTVNTPSLFQNFQLSNEILALGNPTNWAEIIRFNNPAAPVPVDRETYSKEQILDLLNSYATAPGSSAAAGRIAFWGAGTTLEGATTLSWEEASKRLTLSDGQFRAIQVATQVPIHIRAAALGSARLLSLTDSLDAELFGVSRTAVDFAAALTTTFGGPSLFNNTVDLNNPVSVDAVATFSATPVFNAGATFAVGAAVFNGVADFNAAVTMDGGVTFTTLPAVFNVAADFNSAITVDGGATFTTSPVVFNIGADFNNAITVDGGATFTTSPVTFNIGADFNNAITVDGGATFTTSPVTFNIGADFNNAVTFDALVTHSANAQFGSASGSSVIILDDNAVGTSDIRAVDNAQGIRLYSTATFGNNDGARLHLYGTGHANTGQAFLEAVGNASAFISFGTSVSGAAVERQRITSRGEFTFTPGVRTTNGSTRYFQLLTPADTGLTADTESIGSQFGGNSSAATVTRQFTTGGAGFSTQREIVFVHPTYGATAATETITNAATVAITGAPAAGTNMVLTNSYALWVQGGKSEFDGNIAIVSPVRTSTSQRILQVITPADTTLTASTESILNQFGGNTSQATVTRQFATGALTTQRENIFVHPTYAFVGGSTLTNAATVAITDAPAAGTNATITNAFALWIQSGKTQFDGVLKLSPAARTGAAPVVFQIITPADTALTAGTENILNQFGGTTAQATVTRQFSTGALATQRENLFVHPTYAFVGSTTLTNAATVAISNAPQAGTNATLTNAYALWVQAGMTRLDGKVYAIPKYFVNSSSTFATGANTTETNFGQVIITQGSLAKNNDFCEIIMRGLTSANANTKRFRGSLGGTLILDTGAVSYSGGWEMRIKVIRISATLVRCQEIFFATINSGNLTNANINVNTFPSPLTADLTVSNLDSNDLTFQLTATNGTATANDCSQNWSEVYIVNF